MLDRAPRPQILRCPQDDKGCMPYYLVNVKPRKQPDAMNYVPTIYQNSLQENKPDSLRASMPEFDRHCNK